MTATPAEIRLAFEDFLNEVDARGEPFEWTLADAKREFEQWLGRGQPIPFEWNDLYEKVVRDALTDRYRFVIVDSGRWASP